MGEISGVEVGIIVAVVVVSMGCLYVRQKFTFNPPAIIWFAGAIGLLALPLAIAYAALRAMRWL